ncbi:MAG: DUF2341 domain-containing protein [Candidatus Riflebacteria bacterium]|nr:DUF2341 domain-containing protein [Candidatus Riflebacteria bacterium]
MGIQKNQTLPDIIICSAPGQCWVSAVYKLFMAFAPQLLLLIILLFLPLFSPAIYGASAYRQAIEVNSVAALTDFQVLVTMNTAALITAGQMQADGDDIRFTDSDGTTPLPFWVETGTINTVATKIWVRIPNIPINPPDPRKIIHIFYGDPAATSVANGTNTFLFFDDFSGTLAKWTKHKNGANINIVGGYLNCAGGTTSSPYGHTVLGSVNTYNTFVDGIIEGLLYMTTGSIGEVSFRGNYANNTGYKTRWDHRANEGMGFLKPPYANGTWRFWDGSGSGVIPTSKDGIGFATGYWFPFKIAVTGASVKIYQGPTVYSCTDAGTWSPPAPSTPVVNYYPGPGEISLQNHYGTYSRYDDIRVRRITATEPTTLFRGRGQLTINSVTVPQTTVNRGQSGISVAMEIENTGNEPIEFSTANLAFTLGSYTQTLIAPAGGTIIAAGATITASFAVDILADSPLGQATIDGTASATDVLTGLVLEDNSAAITSVWTIQIAPDLIIETITASATAYRGDINRPVLITVKNAGEATAYWNSSTLQFSLGDYTSIYPQTTFPITLLGGATATAIYGVDISQSSPTGTSTIDAEISGTDGNTLYPIMVSGALVPTEWNIPDSYLLTYQDSGHFIPSQSFNRPKVGSTYVYAQAQGLTPIKEFVVRWYDSTGAQVAFSNPAITSNGSGIVAHSCPIELTSPPGTWRVRVTNSLNTINYCENNFEVKEGASLSITLLLPPLVSVGQTFTSTMMVTNNGDTTLLNTIPGTIDTGGSGLATLVSGPIPTIIDLPANSQATFTWTWSAQSPGTFEWSGMAYGFDANSGERQAAPPQPSSDSPGGLRGDYFDALNFTGTQMVRLDPTVDFNWASGAPDSSMGADTFTVRWTGWIMPEFTEDYMFYTSTDDGVRLWVNGVLLVDKWIPQAATEWNGSTIELIAGNKYPVTMEFYEQGGLAVARLSWESPSTPKAVIPASRLFPSSLVDVRQSAEVNLTPSGNGFYAYYYDNMDFTAPRKPKIDPVVNFNWGTAAPEPTMGIDAFTVKWSAWIIPQFTETYTFYTRTDDGAKLWVNDELLVNKWVNQGPTEWSGTIELKAGERYPLKMEYFENGGGAVAELRWSSPSQAKQIIPQAQAIPRPLCMIQSPPSLSILSVIATPTTVFRNQSGIEIEAVIQNSGEATAQVEAASLTFTLGTLTQTVISPLIPVDLPGFNATFTLRFSVDIDLLSPTGSSDFSCNILSNDTNVPASQSWLNLADPHDTWTISQNGLTISAFSSYTPDQSTFNTGQTIYARGFYRTPGQTGRIMLYDTQIPYTTTAPAGQLWTSGNLTADALGNLSTPYSILPSATIGTWTALVRDNGGNVMAIHHFVVQSMGNLVATLTLSPPEVYLGATFTAELSVDNRIVGGSTISPATPWPLKPTDASTGSAILLSGPTPAQGSVPSFSPATFTWVFQATEETGTIGSFSLTASASAVQSYRKPISITSTQTTTNFQVRLVVNTSTLVTAGKMQADCDDIRFRDSDSQTGLSYWLESGANTANTIIWVKIPSLTANTPKTIYLYYGDPTATSGSDGNAVFEFFDHFATLNPTIWDSAGTNSVAGSNLTVTTGAVFTRAAVGSQDGMAAEARIRWSNFSGYSGLAVSNVQGNEINNAGSHKLINLMTNNGGSTSVRARAANGTAASYNITNATSNLLTAGSGTNYILGHGIFGGRVYALRDHTTVLNSYPGTWTGPFYLWLGYITGAQAGGTNISDLVADWVFVRKFIVPEPVVATGNEEATVVYPLISGIDLSTGLATDSNNGISNSIRILQRGIALSSDVIDLGSIPCGETGTAGNSTASNTSNGALTMVRWDPMNLESLEGIIIDKTNLFFSPDPVGAIPAGTRTPASFTLAIPMGQATGTYIATMAIYDDVNTNLVRDLSGLAEPVDFFQVRVVVPETHSIQVVEDVIDLGNWDVGMTTTAVPVQAFNAGNVNLSGLEFKQILGTNSFPISVTPATFTSLATEAYLVADVVATLTVGPADTYIATWTLWNDIDGDHIIDSNEASDSFMVKIEVGMASLSISPNFLDLGIGTPAVTISAQTNVTNTGEVSLDNLHTLLQELEDGSGNAIPASEILITLETVIPEGESRIATATVAVPSGTIAGTYTGEQWIYEDRNFNNLCDADEASASVTLSVVVPQLRRIEVFLDDVNIGGIVPGTTRTIQLDCRNIGNTELPELRWIKSDLQDGTKVLTADNASFPPSEPFNIATGAFFTHDISVSAPLLQASGTYLSMPPHYWLFNDDNSDLDPTGEPNDTFTLRCQIGSMVVDILDTTLSSVGDPAQTSTSVEFLVKNVGDLVVTNAKAVASDLMPVVAGPPDIVSTANVVIPIPIGGFSIGQTKNCSWHVEVPDGCEPATYSGTLTVWEDANNNSLLDAGEMSDSVNLLLTVNSKKVIKVIQDPLNLGWTLSNTTVEGVFEVVNVGNTDLDLVTPLASQMVNLGNTIPASSISFTSLGYMPVGTAKLATVTLVVGYPRADGTYRGYQRIFDDYSGADGLYSANEESCLFELIVNVGYKKLSVTNPVAFGSRNPGQTVTQSFLVKNETTVPLTSIKWLSGTLEDGVNTIPVASLTFIPTTTFGVGGGNTRSCTAQLVLGATLPHGNYIGTHTVWEDNNGDGLIQSSEASATFNTTLTVKPLSGLDIIANMIDAGQIAAGAISPWVEVQFINTGNTDLTQGALYWGFNSLGDGLGHSIAASIITASSTIQPNPVTPGQTGSAYVRIGPVAGGQATGVYFGSLQTLTDGGTASDVCEFTCEITAGGPQNFTSDSVFQNIATTTFPAPAQRYFLSAYICPATGSARLVLIGRDEANANTTQSLGIEFNADTTLTTFGPGIVKAGILDTIQPSATHPYPWYRVYFAFDFAYDPLVASRTYLSLENSSSTAIGSSAVWFDGVQLEKSIFIDQEYPTAFHHGKKIVSPNQTRTISGQRYYTEW